MHPSFTHVPTQIVGPLKIKFDTPQGATIEEVSCPMATFERTLFPSVNRGAKVSRMIESWIETIVTKDCMTRSIVLEVEKFQNLSTISKQMQHELPFLQGETKKTSRYAHLVAFTTQVVGKNIYIRFEFQTGQASGHNMTTKAADHLAAYLIQKYALKYISVSGNTCSDKKNSSINSILGRGKSVNACAEISRKICQEILSTTPEKLVEINTKKNLIWSILSGGVSTANAHFANMVAAVFIATGQDIANVVEGSQWITYCDLTPEGNVNFWVSCPNIIVGTIGNGKHGWEIQERLQNMGCIWNGGSRRFSQIVASLVWCGELSLLSSLTKQWSLMKAHTFFERSKK